MLSVALPRSEEKTAPDTVYVTLTELTSHKKSQFTETFINAIILSNDSLTNVRNNTNL